jgi:hypothetical protein
MKRWKFQARSAFVDADISNADIFDEDLLGFRHADLAKGFW